MRQALEGSVTVPGRLEAAAAPRVDIEMSEAVDRVYKAAQLYRAGKAPVIIVTGDPGFAADAFGHDVADYLVKPVAFDRFAQAWRKAVGKASPAPRTTSNTVFVRTGTDIVRLDLEQVRFIRSESNYVRFLLSDEASYVTGTEIVVDGGLII